MLQPRLLFSGTAIEEAHDDYRYREHLLYKFAK